MLGKCVFVPYSMLFNMFISSAYVYLTFIMISVVIFILTLSFQFRCTRDAGEEGG